MRTLLVVRTVLVLHCVTIFASCATPDAAQLCDARIPRGIQRYRAEVERKYGSIQCEIGRMDAAAVIGGKARIIVSSQDHVHDVAIVTHELLHLWLGTQRWDVGNELYRGGHNAPFTAAKVGPRVVKNVGLNLEDYIEHRMFTPIMRRNGITEGPEQMELVERDIRSFAHLHPYTADAGAAYLQRKLGDEAAAARFADYLRSRNWGLALSAADEFEKIINHENPRTQETAYKAVQDCIDTAFGFGSPFDGLAGPAQPRR
jgi:hypothetical protein